MQYSIKTLVEVDRTRFEVADGDIVSDTSDSLPKAILARLDLKPHYPEVGENQFDDHLYGLKPADLKGMEDLSVVIPADSLDEVAAKLARALNCLDILSRHLDRAMARTHCCITLVVWAK
ncbi:hypothetical protein [uncultured Maricaulis sp.]|uniref:hypothetical protein n=1 Tax=uncultured Maricaulis sp. TaxID=174710 RepID=UPI0030DA585C|tara:strand:- start:227 stop:586 length:360 start_codon:yes stop_codon:yes gene_type:complete